jgi:hypothetical protein
MGHSLENDKRASGFSFSAIFHLSGLRVNRPSEATVIGSQLNFLTIGRFEGTRSQLDSEDLARTTGSSSDITLRNQEAWGSGQEASDQVARNE